MKISTKMETARIKSDLKKKKIKETTFNTVINLDVIKRYRHIDLLMNKDSHVTRYALIKMNHCRKLYRELKTVNMIQILMKKN